jgi:AcrR family transcriptional regulator
MKKRSATGTSKTRSLTRDAVLAEARRLLNEEGLSGLSMRALAGRLEVTPMALYNHVKNRRDLMQGIAEAIVNEIPISFGRGDWRRRLRACFRAFRKTCLANPRAIPLIEMAEVLPAVFRPMETTLGALQEAGLSPREALSAYFLLTNFTLGQASYEVRGPFRGLDPTEAIKRGTIRQDEFPLTVKAAPSKPWDFDRAFEFGLGVIIDGLAARAMKR